MKTTGKLKEINNTQAWFTLEDGGRFTFGKGLSLAGYKAGSEVSVTYDMKGEKKMANRISRRSKGA
jgi:hypothetical protein